MNAVKHLLEQNGFDMSRYHEESFGATPVDVQEDVEEFANGRQRISQLCRHCVLEPGLRVRDRRQHRGR
jgi:ferredoxin-NADP reductase